MAFGSVTLLPGVNTERTPTLLRAGISQSSLVRFKDSLVQKFGGWLRYFSQSASGIPRVLHAWQDLNNVLHLGVGSTMQLGVITSGILKDVTPQSFKSDFAPNISTTASSAVVSITDPNISNVTTFDAVFFNTPVSIGGLILDGLYQITLITGVHSYQITAGSNATTTATNPTATNAITAAGSNTLHFAATPSWVVANMAAADITTAGVIPPGAYVVSTTGTTVVLSCNVVGAGVGSGDNIVFASIPVFATTNGTQLVSVNFIGHGLSVGSTVNFPVSTTGNGVAIAGTYTVVAVADVSNFTISAASQPTQPVTNATTAAGNNTLHFASGTVPSWLAAGMLIADVTTPGAIPSGTTVVSFTATTVVMSANAAGGGVGSGDSISFGATIVMNSGNAELIYWIALGPPTAGSGFGLGPFGGGGFGTGVVGPSQTGTPITATDWSLDNWGELLIACPKNGGIFFWDPTGGFQDAQIVSTAPPFNTGMFVSMSQQILVAFGSSIRKSTGWIGWEQDPLLVKWSTVGDFTNFVVSAATQAGSYRIGIGSVIVGGMAVNNQNLLWTDIDLWAMNYIGPPDVFGFNKIGAGAGLVSQAAAQQLRGSVYWMGRTNFYAYNSGGVSVMPCPVWDSVFQNLNTSFLQNIRAMPNTPFNEVGWLYPSAASTGECDSYVKVNITEPGMPWDYGSLPRSAWIDQSILGMPVGASPSGVVYQHETTPDADGQPLVASFTTGYFFIAEGEDFAFVDQIYPDFKFETFIGTVSAHITISFLVVNFPGDTPTVYGPFTVTQSTQFISTRIRGRQMAILVQSSDLGSWWRIGYVRYRYSVVGRR
jgi:hypothetical protein